MPNKAKCTRCGRSFAECTSHIDCDKNMENAKTLARQIVSIADKKGIAPVAVPEFPKFLIAAGIDPQSITAEIIEEAKRLDRADSRALALKVEALNEKLQGKAPKASEPAPIVEPAKAPKGKAPKAAKSDEAPAPKADATPRVKIFGFAPTSILRWMGVKGWTPEQAATALATMGALNIADATIRIQLKAGAKGERGEPATLTPAQIKKLKAASV